MNHQDKWRYTNRYTISCVPIGSYFPKLFYSVFILEMPINDRDPMILVYDGRDGGSAYGVANGWGVTETLALVGVVVDVPSVVSVSGLLDCLYW